MSALKGFVSLNDIIAPGGPIPLSKSTWWLGISEGIYPAPVQISPGRVAWRVEDIEMLIEKLSEGGQF